MIESTAQQKDDLVIRVIDEKYDSWPKGLHAKTVRALEVIERTMFHGSVYHTMEMKS